LILYPYSDNMKATYIRELFFSFYKYMEKYDHKKIEGKWQEYWEKHPELSFADDDSAKEKKYILDMFPYPSGEGLHVGHVESYTATDIISRYWRMNGKNVLHPQGWDAFGLPAENYAIKSGVHPSETTKKAIATFTKQINSMGFSYDWSREINTSSPEYYKWTQWFFLLLYKNGLAYKKKAKVNWCPSCQTVLANEQVVDGKCERCGSEVIQKDLQQWFFKITDFIENNKDTAGLLDGLEKIDWPESTKSAQKNWIGKSEGAEFDFKIKDSELDIRVYTTRLDTVFGVTYVVVAPEHPIVENLKSRISNPGELEQYLEDSKKKSDLERMEAKIKTGVELEGIKLINPFNGEEVPLFVADYVLSQYGTGAVMAVPAHDERDYEFAKKHNLPIIEVISGGNIEKEAFIDDGVLINSGEYDGKTSQQARELLSEKAEKDGFGKKKVNYRLRDWLVSRQRYWGAPIPIIYCEKCGEVAVPEKDLPVMLPTDVDFKPTGESPLVNSKTFHDVRCPKCGGEARRESDTMDTFVCSSWYYFRYSDPKNDQEFASKENIKKWLPVDLYVGGAEHTVLHLLYARFFTKALHNLGYIEFDEPFLKMRHQGTILAEDGRKMSKSLGNVVNPDQVVQEFGADALRMFEMFMGPLEDMKPWNTKGIIGIVRFLEKVWKLQASIVEQTSASNKTTALAHKTISKVTENIERMRYNTAISQMMILVNALEKEEKISLGDYELLISILAPFAPHITEEIWSRLNHKESIFLQSWPKADPELMKEDEIEMIVQVNGKLRERIFVAPDVTEDEAKETALESEKVKLFTQGKEIRKIIFVPEKLINIVVG
jgi:leucyl-tRNA synthetase